MNVLAMGGHALYVWLAYGSTIAVLLGSFLLLRGARKRQRRHLSWLAAVDAQENPRQDDTPAAVSDVTTIDSETENP